MCMPKIGIPGTCKGQRSSLEGPRVVILLRRGHGGSRVGRGGEVSWSDLKRSSLPVELLLTRRKHQYDYDITAVT